MAQANTSNRFCWETAMAASLAGDAAAYRHLLDEARRWLRRYYARRLPPEAIDDAVQDALIALHRRRATFIPGRPFLPWLAAIARYKWVDRLRQHGRHATDELTEANEPGVPGHEGAVVAGLALGGLLGRLRRAQADVIRLVKLDGWSIAEAAAATGQSEALVKVNIHRGLAALRTLIDGA